MAIVHCRHGAFAVPERDDLILNALRQYGEWAQNELDVLAHFIRPGDTIIDAGAYIGTHARAFSQMTGEQGMVHAFEPNPYSCGELVRNVQLATLPNITIHAVALGARQERRVLVQDTMCTNLGATRLASDGYDAPLGVSVVALDDCDFVKVDFIKADIEGMEHELLAGAARTIRQHQPIIFLELNSLQAAHHIWTWLSTAGYMAFGLLSDAFNPANYRQCTGNMFGDARECGLLLIHRDRVMAWQDSLSAAECPAVETMDSLALLLLHKPQYVGEVLTHTAVARTVGLDFHSPAIAKWEERVTGLGRAVAERQDTIVCRDQTLAERDTRIALLEETVAGQRLTIAQLSQEVEANDSEVMQLQCRVTERDARIGHLEQLCAEGEGRLESVGHALEARERTIGQLLSSRSWRYTKPLRFAGRLLRGEFGIALSPLRQRLQRLSLPRPVVATMTGKMPVAVVLPVYRDVAMTISCIEAAMPGIVNVPGAKMIIVNDASPDAGMQEALECVAKRWPDVVHLLVNEYNRGFVATVNRGIRQVEGHDVVLLNSDVIVPHDWLSRLRAEAYSRHAVATVTPLSNNTTICTFPEFLQDNPVPFGLDVEAIDRFFAGEPMECVEAPTGIGFCMYIRYTALAQVGNFNEERFGRGYGEENDFCQRAVKQGYVNLITPNLYVYHQGGVSFGADKAALVEHATRVIDKLHPNYHADVQAFIAADPLRHARMTRFAQVLADAPVPKILHVSHGIGGGVDQHIDELADALGTRAACLLLVPYRDSGVELRFGVRKTADSLVFELPRQSDELIGLLRGLHISLIHYHHVLRLPREVIDLPHALQADHVLTVHDFYLLNGNPTLTDKQGVFPGHYQEDLVNPDYPLPAGVTPAQWRDRYRSFVESAATVIFPSRSARELFGDLYRMRRTTVAAHPEHWRNIGTNVRQIGSKERYTIGVIGAIGKEKGADLLEAVARLARDWRLPFDFTLIGYACRTLRGVQTTGPYQAPELRHLLDFHRIDACFFPNRCPETYSYTLSYALDAGLPIFAPRIGAFPERLAGRKGVSVYHHLASPETVLAQLVAFVERLVRHEVYPDGTPPTGEAASTTFYEQEYLALCRPAQSNGDWPKFDRWLATLSPRERSVREEVLALLLSIYRHRAMRWVDLVVPFNVRREIKRFLSRVPEREVSP